MIDKKSFINRTALFHTFGCKLNFAETATIADMFAEHGIATATADDVPDFIVINSCSVTETADKKCRQAIRSFARRFPKAAILVTGCYVQLKPEEVLALPGVRVVAGTDKKLSLLDYALSLDTLSEETECFHTLTKDIRSFSPSCSKGDRTRYFLKVQDGCDYYCSYCTIPMARGRSRSGSINEIVDQARMVAASGGKEIVITGVNIGDFGKGTDQSFIDLCRALDKVDGIERYRISSIEPNLLTDELIDFTASSHKFMPHFHIPLQSGSDEVLRLMRRRYDTSLFRSKIEKIRDVMPDAFIGVDVIVGARGEREDLFEESKHFVESIDISRLHVFSYSERPGTRALDIKPVISQEEKHHRTRRMLDVSEKKLKEFTSRFTGTERPVLIEHPRIDGSMAGFTDNYLRVIVTNPRESEANTIIPVRLGIYNPDEEHSIGEVIR